MSGTTAISSEKLIIADPKPEERSGFFANYLKHVPAGQTGRLLVEQIEPTERLYSALDRTTAQTLHDPYTWSLNQVLGHLIDCERVFGYRAARIAAGDASGLPGFDENLMVIRADYHNADTSLLLEEWKALRVANVRMFSRLSAEQLEQTGVVSGNSLSARAAAGIIVGHLEHHQAIVRKRLGLE